MQEHRSVSEIISISRGVPLVSSIVPIPPFKTPLNPLKGTLLAHDVCFSSFFFSPLSVPIPPFKGARGMLLFARRSIILFHIPPAPLQRGNCQVPRLNEITPLRTACSGRNDGEREEWRAPA